MPSTARAFYDEITAGPDSVKYIESLKDAAEPVTENEWRDFKALPTNISDKDLRRIWSEGLAAFANTAGGVIVWGVVAKRGLDRLDRVQENAPIADPDAATQKLRQWLLEATNPPVAGVIITPLKRTDGTGYIVCYIPESNNKPHRSEFSEGKPYLIRVGDNSVNPNPALLRALFFPVAKLKLEFQVTAGDFSDGPLLTFTLKNTGLVSAKELSIVYTAFASDYTLETLTGDGEQRKNRSVRVDYVGTFHPGELKPVLRVKGGSHPSGWGAKLTIVAVASDSPMLVGEFDISFREDTSSQWRVQMIPKLYED